MAFRIDMSFSMGLWFDFFFGFGVEVKRGFVGWLDGSKYDFWMWLCFEGDKESKGLKRESKLEDSHIEILELKFGAWQELQYQETFSRSLYMAEFIAMHLV